MSTRWYEPRNYRCGSFDAYENLVSKLEAKYEGLHKAFTGREKSIDELLKNLPDQNARKLYYALKIIEMVEDNTKMPHPHNDPQTRLYCLAERANEFFEKTMRGL